MADKFAEENHLVGKSVLVQIVFLKMCGLADNAHEQ